MKTTHQITDWIAQWIWSPGKLRSPIHVAYFRKEIKLEGPARKAILKCAADSKYRVWVNGEYYGFGPARGDKNLPYYDTRRIPLKAGKNTIAFLVEHYTRPGTMFASVEPGLICQIEDGNKVLASTDSAWQSCTAKAYSSIPGCLYPVCYDAGQDPEGWQLPGHESSVWRPAKVLKKTKLAPPANLLPRPIPLIEEQRLVPSRLLDIWHWPIEDCTDLRNNPDLGASLWRCQKGRLDNAPYDPKQETPRSWTGKPLRLTMKERSAVCMIVDFGKGLLACPELLAAGAKGVIVDFGYSESLDHDRVATILQGIRQSERIILREGTTHHRMIQPRGFRFMIVRFANTTGCRQKVTLKDLSAHEAIYPAKPIGRFACSDPLLEQIYQLSARTINLCMEDAYTDCPWRERAQWVGDAQPETLFSYYCFGAYDLARKAVLEFTGGNTAEGWIPGVFPTGRPNNLPTWGMRVPVIAWEYFLYSGDRTVLPSITSGVHRQMEWLAGFEDENCILVNLPGWCFVDWTKLEARNNDGAIQGWYLEALEYSARLAQETGETEAAKGYRAKSRLLRRSLARLYWSKERKAFLKYRPGSDRRPKGVSPELIGQHENFLFALLGVGTDKQRDHAIRAMAGATGRYLPSLGDYQNVFRPAGMDQLGDHSDGAIVGNVTGGDEVVRIGSPFWSYYALLTLMESGRVDAALEYIRLCWGLMLEFGATTCWEMWDRHTSHCHGWSAAPAMILPAYVLGVKPLTPGFKQFEVRPRPGSLTWAKGRVPTPQGIIEVEWRLEERAAVLKLKVPKNTEALVSWSMAGRVEMRRVTVNGKQDAGTELRPLGEGRHHLRFEVSSKW